MAVFFATYGSLIVAMLLAAMLALSLYLPLLAGQLSLASPGFYALGGYVAAIISTRVVPFDSGAQAYIWRMGTHEVARFSGPLYPVSLLIVEMLVAGVLSAVLAIVLGLPALRLRGIYLLLATIAFVQILQVVTQVLDLTGGAIGIFNIPQPFASQLGYAWVVVPLLLLSAGFVYRLERIRIGRAFTAIREDELAAAAMGINLAYHKVLAFTMGAVLAGIVGVISAHSINTWNSRQGTFDAGITYLAFVLIGGSRTFLGPIIGGIVLYALPEVLRGLAAIPGLPLALAQLLKDGRLIMYGLLLVLGTIFFPQGLIRPNLFRHRTVEATPRKIEQQ
ncbi:MAG: branched-chain amino acid ABC transporter permease [Herpetosiphonaceae bacterium]|nr:branched-chain amino acid ABC transporter permease [Herpetosiphonaceae bacterium]